MSTEMETNNRIFESHPNNYEPESPRSSSIERSLAELDTLLTDDLSGRTQSENTTSPARNIKDGKENNKILQNSTLRSFDMISNEKQLIASSEMDDKSMSKNSVQSKASTVLAGGLISNIDKVNADFAREVRSVQDQSTKSVSSRKTSKSAPTMSRNVRPRRGSKSRRLRGKSLEREISRIVHLSADQSSQNFLDESGEPTTSTEDILNDLMATTVSNTNQSGSQLRDLASLLDRAESEEESTKSEAEGPHLVHVSPRDKILEYDSLSNATSLVDSDDDSTTTTSDPLRIKNSNGQEMMSDGSDHDKDPFSEDIPDSALLEETLPTNRQLFPDDAVDETSKKEKDWDSCSTGSDNDDQNSEEGTEVITEEIESFVEPSIDGYKRRYRHLKLLSSSPSLLEMTSPDKELYQNEETESLPVINAMDQDKEKSSNYAIKTAESEQMDDTVETTPLDGSSFAFSTSKEDEEWTSFGHTSYFGETFSPEKHARKGTHDNHSSPTPTDVSEPDSPYSIMDLPAPNRDTRKKSADTNGNFDFDDMPYDATFPMASSKRKVKLPY
mmetsp:Transcript_24796/g.37686  ORF Transcript_24796/g.37686 Transcript_24796/m.37686 type:complete len:557 (+) Transcript_24796:61-1731(+)